MVIALGKTFLITKLCNDASQNEVIQVTKLLDIF